MPWLQANVSCPCVSGLVWINLGRMRLRDVAIPISILLGFAMLSAALVFKDNDFEACVRLFDANLPTTVEKNRELYSVRECTGQ